MIITVNILTIIKTHCFTIKYLVLANFDNGKAGMGAKLTSEVARDQYQIVTYIKYYCPIIN